MGLAEAQPFRLDVVMLLGNIEVAAPRFYTCVHEHGQNVQRPQTQLAAAGAAAAE